MNRNLSCTQSHPRSFQRAGTVSGNCSRLRATSRPPTPSSTSCMSSRPSNAGTLLPNTPWTACLLWMCSLHIACPLGRLRRLLAAMHLGGQRGGEEAVDVAVEHALGIAGLGLGAQVLHHLV